jgi:hypothetical protein
MDLPSRLIHCRILTELPAQLQLTSKYYFEPPGVHPMDAGDAKS